jgi:ketosteroid isomerase-like protein
MPNKLELAKRSMRAFNDGDTDTYVETFAEDVEWRMSAFVTGKGAYRGREGVREFIGELEALERDHGERFEIELTEFTEVDEQRVMGLGEARIVRSQNPLSFEVGAIYTFAGGLIVALEGMTSHAETRKAAGLA